MRRITAFLLVLAMAMAFLPQASASESIPNGEKIVYGLSGEGRELCAYRYGNGENVLIMGFAIHGFEDNFDRDGECLVYTGELIMEYLSTSLLPQAHNWSVYILPCMNPDGLYSGWTNYGPGRCTTTMLDENDQLVEGIGIDMNRCFPPMNYYGWSARNYTTTRPMSCLEARALAQFVQDVRGSATNILIDTHGWLTQNFFDSERVGQALRNHFPYNYNIWSSGASGYLVGYAASLGYETGLLELPYDVYSLEGYKESGYAERVLNVTLDLIQSEPCVCELNGHTFETVSIPVSCTQDGQSGTRCTTCGYSRISVTQAPGHTVRASSVVTVSLSTATQAGIYSYTCANCGQRGLTGCTSSFFKDTDADAYYAEALDFCYEQGIVSGIVPGIFGSQFTVTREMLVTMLHRLAGSPEAETTAEFEDLLRCKNREAIDWAVSCGIISGVDDVNFAPDAPVTREQAVLILYRYAQTQGLDDGERKTLLFRDADQISLIAKEAVRWAAGNKIVTNLPSVDFSPQSYPDRAQIITMIYRMVMRSTASSR